MVIGRSAIRNLRLDNNARERERERGGGREGKEGTDVDFTRITHIDIATSDW